MKKIVPEDAHLMPKNAKKVFSGTIFDVYQWPQTMYDGSTQTFEMLRRPDTVTVIAIKDDKIVVLKQTQPTMDEPFLGFPGGRADEGETSIQAAKRELLEETGLSFKNWRLINVVQPVQKIEWFIFTYLATEFENQTQSKYDVGEKIEQMNLSFEEVKKSSDGQVRIDDALLTGYASLEELKNAPEYKGKEVET